MKHELLIYLAKKTGFYSSVDISTSIVAKELQISQQSASRILIEMEKEGYVTRKLSSRGIEVKLTEKTIEYLKKEYILLKKLFKTRKDITGKLFQGLGEGRFYVKKYEKQIEKELGFKPYPGTLNLKVKINDARSFISDLKPITIHEFKTRDRTYGKVILYKVIVGGVEAGIIIPERTVHDESTVEIIGPTCFRTALNLKEGDKVKIDKNLLEMI